METSKEPLGPHTWFKIGGPAELIEPTSKEKFVSAIEWCIEQGRPYRILGNGSNVLVSDNGIDDVVIKNTSACTDLEVDGNTVIAGSSVLLPQFIRFFVEQGLGGVEYLYSVPGTIGGAIFMNAGRGKKYNKTISDYLVSVEVHDGERVRDVSVGELDFEHRYSTFQDKPNWVILSATFELPSQDKEIGREKIQERMGYIKTRDRSTPNAGSVFKNGTSLPMRLLSFGGAGFVQDNRIGNVDDASSSDIERLIWITEVLHKYIPTLEERDLEIRVWK